MRVQPSPPNSPTFGYSHQIKTLYKKGQFPQVRWGIYGERLTQKNVTLEHLHPISQGGKTELGNLALTSREMNNKRGDKPLRDFLNLTTMAKYLEQFKNLKVKGFDGNEYIKKILENIGVIL
ncbi:MAG: HNH endonuclease [Muribaculaceae bacterium]|nr:HNH endonuclease [Muribaculaceae bacterium]